MLRRGRVTDAAGLGVGTLYRHFPRRADLIVAVLQHEIDACAEAGSVLRDRAPLTRRCVNGCVGYRSPRRYQARTGRGPPIRILAFAGLHDYVTERLEPVVADLLADLRAAGELDSELDARELLYAVGLLGQPVPADGFDFDYNRRMAMVFVEGLRHPAGWTTMR